MALCSLHGQKEGKSMKGRRAPMTKGEKAQRRAEKERQAINQLKEFVAKPPSPLDRLLEALGRPPTLEQRLKEIGRSVLQAYEKFSRAAKDKDAD
jgi:hypothetical protein